MYGKFLENILMFNAGVPGTSYKLDEPCDHNHFSYVTIAYLVRIIRHLRIWTAYVPLPDSDVLEIMNAIHLTLQHNLTKRL